ncbi:hypothetical protein F4861DRAFT_540419 [Xylaria intraflava]|nr:hypothetical protein F4861DRAFT_540419 [Xylaria intraflava]
MSSRSSSTSHSSSSHSSNGHNDSGSVVTRQDVFRSHKSKDHHGTLTERVYPDGRRVAIYNHHARGYEEDAPTPDYGNSSNSRRAN